VHPRGESKKFNIARGESTKKLQDGKTKFVHITEGINLFTQKYFILTLIIIPLQAISALLNSKC
jgi:hypothetical protein